MENMMMCFVLLLFMPVVCGFNHVFVLVVEESAYLNAIYGKGHLADYNLKNQTTSVVSTLQSRGMSWTVYTDDYKKCSLSPSITSKYKYLIQDSDVNSTTCQNIANGAEIEGDANIFKLPTVAFYFPDTMNMSNSNWLRAFMHPIFGSSDFLKNTLTIILAQGKHNNTRALLIGRDAQAPRDDNATREALLTQLDAQYGISLIDVPSPRPPMLFDRIFFVVLENQPLNSALKCTIMRNTALQGTLLTKFDAIVNPSQPNYIAMIAGDLLGVRDDADHNLSNRSLIDTFEEKEISWRAYMENYPPGLCFVDSASTDKLYVRKHNPFISFDSIRNNMSRCAKIVPANLLDFDINGNSLPRYMFYTPNMNNDGHDTSMVFSSKWLNTFIVPKLLNQNFMDKTLVVITFDEGTKSDNRIYTLLIGDMVPYGSLDNTSYTHYSLLRLVEDQFKLPLLGRHDVTAVQINASHFYPGEVHAPPVNKLIFIGIALGCVFVVLLISIAAVLIRRRRKKNAYVGAQQRAFLHHMDEDDDYDEEEENDEVAGTRLPSIRKLTTWKQQKQV